MSGPYTTLCNRCGEGGMNVFDDGRGVELCLRCRTPEQEKPRDWPYASFLLALTLPVLDAMPAPDDDVNEIGRLAARIRRFFSGEEVA